MLCRLTLLMLLGAVSACDAPPGKQPVQPAVQEKKAPEPSTQQVEELSVQCEKKSRDQFRRDWQDGTPDGRTTAEFASHYNVKRNTCFYLLTVASAGTHRQMLFDINDGEQYGEYLGPAAAGSPATGLPTTCRIEGMYCASRREWGVLVGPYMEE
jgi:hypothetical protein